MNDSMVLKIENLFSQESYSDKPFPHALVSDLLSEHFFSYLNRKIEHFLSLKVNMLALEEQYNRRKKKFPKKTPKIVYRKDTWNELGIDSKLFKGIEDEILKVKEKIFEFYHQSRFSNSYRVGMFFAFSLPQTKYVIHDDLPSKCWTLAYYIYPPKNEGTILHDLANAKSYKYQWRLNSGIAFCPKDRVTWHSYHNPSSDEVRVALVMNIVRD